MTIEKYIRKYVFKCNDLKVQCITDKYEQLLPFVCDTKLFTELNNNIYIIRQKLNHMITEFETKYNNNKIDKKYESNLCDLIRYYIFVYDIMSDANIKFDKFNDLEDEKYKYSDIDKLINENLIKIEFHEKEKMSNINNLNDKNNTKFIENYKKSINKHIHKIKHLIKKNKKLIKNKVKQIEKYDMKYIEKENIQYKKNISEKICIDICKLSDIDKKIYKNKCDIKTKTITIIEKKNKNGNQKIIKENICNLNSLISNVIELKSLKKLRAKYIY